MDWKKEAEKISEWIKKRVVAAGAHGVALGISGGIDSAVVAKLAVDALGPDDVHALILPCFSSEKDANDGLLVCEWLGLKPKEFDLSRLQEKIEDTFCEKEDNLSKLASANIKARLRMIFLMALCNQENLLNIGTTNKSEYMIGYFTKYGDGGVDIEPIEEYFKTEIFEMAKAIGVPQKIIDRKPSAGLWEGQTDEQEIGMPYEDLDWLLRNIEKTPKDYPMFYTIDPKALHIQEMVVRSAHKRRMPPKYSRDKEETKNEDVIDCGSAE